MVSFDRLEITAFVFGDGRADSRFRAGTCGQIRRWLWARWSNNELDRAVLFAAGDDGTVRNGFMRVNDSNAGQCAPRLDIPECCPGARVRVVTDRVRA